MSKAIDKLRGHPDYPNVSDEVMKEYEMERLMELAIEKEWIDSEISALKRKLGGDNEITQA